MGWWRRGEMVLGDGPVDLFEEGMGEYVREKCKPDWLKFLDALSLALHGSPQITAVFKPGGARLDADARRADPDLVQVLSGIVNNICGEYRDYLDRNPTLGEILATVDFSLGVRPERFLSAKGQLPELDRLELESRK